MNELGIYWIRPKFVWYTDSEDKKRRYYPDFYLPDYDIYLDPKNDYLIQTDTDKITRAAQQNQIKIFVLAENSLTLEAVRKLVGLP
jgi:hypothetical protein